LKFFSLHLGTKGLMAMAMSPFPLRREACPVTFPA
jgi:hypothetical protein